MSNEWNIWIDTGGTFTDCLAIDSRGVVHREKVLSSGALRGTISDVITPQELRIDSSWQAPKDFLRGFEFCLLDTTHARVRVAAYEQSSIHLDTPLPDAVAGHTFEVRSTDEAPILAARLATSTAAGAPLPPLSMRLATTRGTNALLERRGAPVAFFVTEGFGDLLEIGYQQRPDLFALDIQKPKPLYRTVVEVPERLDANGTVVRAIDLSGFEEDVSELLNAGIRQAAVVFLHSYRNSAHEERLTDFLIEQGFDHVSRSSDLVPFIKAIPRAETTVVNSYLTPIIDSYLQRVEDALTGGRLHVMTSAGGLVQPESYRPKDSLLSGPAGGVVGAVEAGRRSGFEKIIAFDMGGTSTDVARFNNDYDYVFEHEVGDAHLVAPALAIESVAAGGGSVCRYDGGELTVGPESAGAIPGPACYGAGGPLALTDVNLLLGRLDRQRFDIPIDIEAAERAFEELFAAVNERKKISVSREDFLEGLCDVANERMADAIRKISVRQGYDPAVHVLVAFGGAGPQHACAVAKHLGMRAIVVPEDASLLSAMGLGGAAIERFAEQQVLQTMDEIGGDISEWVDELSETATTYVVNEGVDVAVRRTIVSVRFAGQETALQIDYDAATPIEKAFETRYRDIYGYWPDSGQVEVESIRVIASSGPGGTPSYVGRESGRQAEPVNARSWFNGEWQDVPAVERDTLVTGDKVDGPALISEPHTVTVVDPGWFAEVDGADALILRRSDVRTPSRHADRPGVVTLELFTHRFETIVREMGEMFQRTAVSTNVKERLDFSCAMLDVSGELIVNAPHIPVHLGALGVCVREVQASLPLEPGDVIVTNHPEFGGSHLPDVTVITPVYAESGGLLGYVANRAHHAEIGGIRPGSMPPSAMSLPEEGVVIPPTYLFRRGEARWEDIRAILCGAPYPTRRVDENMADLHAAVAANRHGAGMLCRLASEHGEKIVHHYMETLKERAAACIRSALQKIPDGVYEALEHMDDGSPLCVTIDITDDHAHFDFTGSSGVHPGNLNATRAVVHSVVVYVLRLLVGEPLPLNEGLMRPVRLTVPAGILNPPFPEDSSKAPAVVGGNIETSQRLVGCLLKALGLAACSQATMNNVAFGTAHYSYYETVCGGAGAGPSFEGASAVHTHMTKRRITDPEILEHRYPVRVDRFAIRRLSGGNGTYRGGDGAIRELTFLDEMSLSVLGQHRVDGPFGLAGGEPGKPAVQRIERVDGKIETLNSIDGRDVHTGDRFILETPGGGGFGPATAMKKD